MVSKMDEFELQSWERELAAWKRKLAGAPPAMHEEVEAIAVEISRVRQRVREGIHVSGERVTRHFSRLRDLWEYCQADASRTTPA
jgi:hypothetical protein